MDFPRLRARRSAAHSGCWGALGPPLTEGERAASTRERWTQVHELRVKGVGQFECARWLKLPMNTVRRYDRAPPSLRR
jgi:hypothetical protein